MPVEIENYVGGVPVVVLATDGTKLYGVLVDTDGHLQVDVLNLGNYMHADNVLAGYSDTYFQSMYVHNHAAGSHTFSASTVPAGEMWVVTAISAYDADNILDGIRFIKREDTIDGIFHAGYPSEGGEIIAWSGQVYLKEGNKILVLMMGMQDGDDIYTVIHGYKMKV